MTITTVAARPSARPTPALPVHGTLPGLGADDHAQYALLAGRTGGQVLYGGSGVGETLTLRGSDQTGANRGDVILSGRTRLENILDQAPTGGTVYTAILSEQSPTFTSPTSVVGLSGKGVNTVSTNVFFYSAVEVTAEFNQTVDSLFAAFLLFNAAPLITRGDGNSFGAAILLAKPQYVHTGTGAMNIVGSEIAVNHDPRFINNLTGTLNIVNSVGLRHVPFFNAPAGSTINLTLSAGMDVGIDAGSVVGTLTVGDFYGLRMNDLGNGVLPTGKSAAVFSESREITTTSGQRGLVTQGAGGIRAGRNEFIGGGVTIMHGTAWTPKTQQLAAGIVNDFNLGWTTNSDVTRAWVRITPAAGAPGTTTLNGITVSYTRTGQLLCLTNILAITTLVLADEAGASTPANRIRTGFTPGSGLPNLELAEGQSAWMLYDDITNRWRVISHTGTYIA